MYISQKTVIFMAIVHAGLFSGVSLRYRQSFPELFLTQVGFCWTFEFSSCAVRFFNCAVNLGKQVE